MGPELRVAAFESLAEEIAILDAEGRIVAANAAWERAARALGVTSWLGRPYGEVWATGPGDRTGLAQLNKGIADVCAGVATEFGLEYRSREDGVWSLLCVRPLAGGGGAVVAHDDITERKRVEERLAAQNELLLDLNRRTQALQEALRVEASTDGLTGLLNRRQLDRRTAEAVRVARRHGRPLACLMVDLDHFKDVNDNFGHQVGDDALREVAQRLRLTCRRSDVIGRYGGEEFVVLLPETDAEGAMVMAERIRDAIAAPPFVTRHRGVEIEVALAASVGVACFGEDARERLMLYAAADRALYAAKRGGRNQVAAAGVANAQTG